MIKRLLKVILFIPFLAISMVQAVYYGLAWIIIGRWTKNDPFVCKLSDW